jgi:hypothetical protein
MGASAWKVETELSPAKAATASNSLPALEYQAVLTPFRNTSIYLQLSPLLSFDNWHLSERAFLAQVLTTHEIPDLHGSFETWSPPARGT